MQIALKVDTVRLLSRLRNADKRIAFAVVNAINETAKTAQQAVRHHVSDAFTVRKPSFVLREAAIIQFASVRKGKAFAEIYVGRKKRFLLPYFEAGGLREPVRGKNVAVPIEARPTKQADIPESLYFRALAFRRPKATTTATRRARRRGAVGKTWIGNLGTYLIPGVGVFQRRAAGAISRVLYIFKRPFQLPAGRLKFVETVSGVAGRAFPENLAREISETLERKR